MKRILLALAIAAGALVPVSSGAAAAKPPALTGVNTLRATGSRVLTVTIPRKLAVTWYDAIWNGAARTTGTYGGYALVQQTPRKQGRILMVTQLAHPAGCRQDGSGCTPIRIRYVKGPKGAGSVNMSAGMTTVLEAGTYLMYGFTDPGKTLTASVALRGLAGKKTWTATKPAAMSLAQSMPAPLPAGVGSESKKLSGRLSGRGLVIGGTWATPSNGVVVDDPTRTANGGATLAVTTQCWEKKNGAAQDPLTMCGYGVNPAAAQPDMHVDNLGLGRPLSSWLATGNYSYAYNLVAAVEPLGRFGAYALWWTTG